MNVLRTPPANCCLLLAALCLLTSACSGQEPVLDILPCPDHCNCSADGKKVVCERGGMWGPLPTGEMAAHLVEELRVSAPPGGPANNLTVGPLFRGFTNLRSLVITNSAVPALGSKSFLGLIHLQELNLSGNAVRQLTADCLVGLPSLTLLVLENNQLVSVPSGAFQQVSALRRLSLAGNKLRTLAPRIFQGLEGLLSLDLSRNPLRHLDKDVFRDVQGLLELHVSGCRLSSLSELPILPQLRLLDASDNMLENPVSVDTITLWPDLRKLDLSGNLLTVLPVSSLPSRLEALSLARNRLSDVRDLPLPVWLRQLDLASNPLHPSAVWSLLQEKRQLRNLSLAYTSLPEIPSELVPSVLRLRSLNLSGNAWICSQCHVGTLLEAVEDYSNQLIVEIQWPTCRWPSTFQGIKLSQLKAKDLPDCSFPWAYEGAFGVYNSNNTIAALVGVSILMFAAAFAIITWMVYRKHHVAHYYTHEELLPPNQNGGFEPASDSTWDIRSPLMSGERINTIERLSVLSGSKNFVDIT